MSHNLAAIVDPGDGGGPRDGAGDIDRAEAAAAIEEAMEVTRGRTEEIPYDLAAIVDPGGA